MLRRDKSRKSCRKRRETARTRPEWLSEVQDHEGEHDGDRERDAHRGEVRGAERISDVGFGFGALGHRDRFDLDEMHPCVFDRMPASPDSKLVPRAVVVPDVTGSAVEGDGDLGDLALADAIRPQHR
jgi:hypothetical protein